MHIGLDKFSCLSPVFTQFPTDAAFNRHVVTQLAPKSQHRPWLGADPFFCQYQLVFTHRVTISDTICQKVAISK